MPFISKTVERTALQTTIYDDGSKVADFDETFDAALGFAIDEGLSTSRMLNNEMYENRRIEAKKIFDSGVSRGKFINGKGIIDYNAMALQYETIQPDKELYDQKKMLLAERREYYNDVMRRSDSTAGNLLGSMTGFMLDPINVSTMAIATPFVVAKGVGVLGKALRGATGAAVVNVATEALIQPFVLDYKLDIDSPYGAMDAITNLAMAAGGGFVLGGAVGGISGWLRKIQADVDNTKLNPEVSPEDIKIAKAQVDEMIDTLKPATYSHFDARVSATAKIKAELAESGDTASLSKMKQGKIPKEVGERIDAEVKAQKTQAKELNPNVFDADEFRAAEIEKAEKPLTKPELKKLDEEVNNKKVEAEAAYLRGIEEERTKMNAAPKDIEIKKVDDITNQQLDEVFRAIENPKVIIDGKFADAGKIVKQIDDDIAAIEAIRTCSLG